MVLGIRHRARVEAPLGSSLRKLRAPKSGFALIEISLPRLGGFSTGRAQMPGIHASYALACTNCIVKLLAKASVLILGVLLHINLPVFVRQIRDSIEFRWVRGGAVIPVSVAAALSLPFTLRGRDFGRKAFFRGSRCAGKKLRLSSIMARPLLGSIQ